MNKEDFKKLLPHLEEWDAITTADIHSALMRSSGFLEAVEGLKSNPDIAARLNLNEIKLLQALVRLVFTLQCRVLDQEKIIKNTDSIQNENNHLSELLSQATEDRNRHQDQVEILTMRVNTLTALKGKKSRS